MNSKADGAEGSIETSFSLSEERLSLTTLCWLFFRIACSSFGGYMAMISATQNLVVERRKLLSDDDVLNGVSLASILPGPIAINVVAYVGYRLRGNLGALVSVCAAITPALLLMLLLSFAYIHLAHLEVVGHIFAGVVPAVASIILAAAWSMWRKSINTKREAALAIAAAAALLYISGIATTLVVIALAAIMGWWWFGRSGATSYSSVTAGFSGSLNEAVSFSVNPPVLLKSPDRSVPSAQSNLLLLASVPSLALITFISPGIFFKLFYVFASFSLLMFGGAYVFIPVLQDAVVSTYGWVTQREFVDAVAMSQMMPGPVIVSVAFIGFKAAGLLGALVSIVAIILPSTVVMLLCTRMLDRIQQSQASRAALRGVRAAVVGMVIAAALLIGKTSDPSWISLAIFIAALIALLRYRIEAVWLLPVAGLCGFLMY